MVLANIEMMIIVKIEMMVIVSHRKYWTISYDSKISELSWKLSSMHTGEGQEALASKLYGPWRGKPWFCYLRRTKVQTSLHIRAVWSAPLLFAIWKKMKLGEISLNSPFYFGGLQHDVAG